ncbi:MAG TPA: mannose-6-phosphate isomerase, class I [Chitinophagaceae bacterium]|nr:mannose-6-phosphate isomerase, class I [Chitinophagaceae bacterium]
MQTIYKLQGKIQHYSWGGYHFIPRLLNIENKNHLPFAEYWLGAHPNHPSSIKENGTSIPLNDFIVNKNIQPLPYLLKVLDVRQMLSIQVHPNKASAKIGFENENKLNIPVTAAHRNYKDNNHKPELLVALSDFWLLHGFKPLHELHQTLKETTELNFLIPFLENGDYRCLYEHVMLMKQGEINIILQELSDRILPSYKENLLQKNSADFWAARAIESFCPDKNYDKGIFSIYFFNLLHLKEGQGIFQPEGLPHAYLEGQNVEIMANSDNVLRAGLTDKHIDVPELLRHVKFEATFPNILQAGAKENLFAPPVDEFSITRFQLEANESKKIKATAASILLIVKGEIEAGENEYEMALSKGEAAFFTGDIELSVTANNDALFFLAQIP